MEVLLTKYSSEVIDFLNADTLKAIDWGVLDLGKIENYELRKVLIHFEYILALELKMNYQNNNTGIFRVSRKGNSWCYRENTCVIKASSLKDLKKLVIEENRIWYVFDEELIRR